MVATARARLSGQSGGGETHKRKVLAVASAALSYINALDYCLSTLLHRAIVNNAEKLRNEFPLSARWTNTHTRNMWQRPKKKR